MSNITESNVAGETVFLADKIEVSETMTGTVSGTAATVTDTTTYPVASQAGKTEKVTTADIAEQTVTFTDAIDYASIVDKTSYPCSSQAGLTSVITVQGVAQTVEFVGAVTTAAAAIEEFNEQLSGAVATASGAQVRITSDTAGSTSSISAAAGTGGLTWDAASDINTAAGVAAEMNDQLGGVSIAVDSGQVVISTDAVGSDQTVAIGTGTATLTWDTPVAGTGSSATSLTVARGTLMARNTSTTYMVPYVASGANGTGTITGVIDTEQVFTATGQRTVKIAKSGTVDASKLVVQATQIAPTVLVIDQMEKDTGIIAKTVAGTSRSDV